MFVASVSIKELYKNRRANVTWSLYGNLIDKRLKHSYFRSMNWSSYARLAVELVKK